MNVLLSIKPEFAEKILDGEKRYEFRKTRFRAPTEVENVYMYASSPEQALVGSFTFTSVIEDHPERLWEKYGHESGIDDQSRYMEYFSDRSTGYAIKVDEVRSLSSPIDPRKEIQDFRPPVSFQYVNGRFSRLFNQRRKQCSSD